MAPARPGPIARDLYVGYFGNGTLTIRNGGAVSNGFGFIGVDSGSTGAATVDGAGSTWTNSGDLYVGYCRQRHADHPQRRRGEQWRRRYLGFLSRRDRRRDGGRRRLDLDQ